MGAPTNTSRIEALEKFVASTASHDDLNRAEERLNQQLKELRELILASMAATTNRNQSENGGPAAHDTVTPEVRREPELPPERPETGNQLRFPVPRVDFPKFDGGDARSWIRKCQRYFLLNPMVDENKVMLAGMNLEGSAEYWFMDHIEGKDINWNRFVELFLNRFVSLRNEDVIGEFNKLKQTTTVEKYIEKFAELRSYMLYRDCHLDEFYFLRSFYSGLKEEIRHMVELLCPHNLEQAYMMARKQEIVVESWSKGGKPTPRVPVWPRENKTSDFSKRELPTTGNGLCFNCDEPYTFGHKCQKLFVLIMEDEESEPASELSGELDEEELDCGVSLHALRGQVPTDTIKLAGKVKNNQLVILVDSGSTHSFLDPNVVAKVKCEVEVTNPLQVTVAGGGKIICSSRCPDFEWEMAGHVFSANLMTGLNGAKERLLGAALGSVLTGFVVFEQRKSIYRSISHSEFQPAEPIFGRESRQEFAHIWNKSVDKTLGSLVESLSSRGW
ncbi:hypothetical protein CASFOL_032969 [Castilleja foliolosa]|uniref:Ty3 transposon capsid-like protein domain-containing protein n=1 Tax=Castilleja foliolosa TaxID=1961234 RepID=A0ABD3C3W1_9LAMI